MNHDLKERLNEEVLRLSGYSIDRGSVDAGIAANLAWEALARIEQLEADLEKARKALNFIDALDPEDHIYGVSHDACRGLIIRMGQSARATLQEISR